VRVVDLAVDLGLAKRVHRYQRGALAKGNLYDARLRKSGQDASNECGSTQRGLAYGEAYPDKALPVGQGEVVGAWVGVERLLCAADHDHHGSARAAV